MKERVLKTEIVVIGAGVVGCAIALKLAEAGHTPWILEQAEQVGTGVSSRNSGVVHSGLYYPPDSLKAQTCVRGNRLLYAWCTKHGVSHRKIGKLVIAKTPLQVEEIEKIYLNCQQRETIGVGIVPSSKIPLLEKHLTGLAALYCQETGIVDVHSLTQSFLLRAQENGANAIFSTKVVGIQKSSQGFELQTSRGNITCEKLVNSAGLNSVEISKMMGISLYQIHPWCGDYYRIVGKIPFLHLIYPVKTKGKVGLGVHLTLELDGQAKLGPDSYYGNFPTQPEEYEKKSQLFFSSAQELLGPWCSLKISYDTFGIRPTLRPKNSVDEKDFVISQDLPGLINCIGIESPGLTSALAIGEVVVKMIRL